MGSKDPLTIISQLESLLKELRSSISSGHSGSRRSGSKKSTGLAGDLHSLIGEGFFDQPKTLSEIHEKLRVEGINKPKTSLMKPLLSLIKNKALKRERPEKGQFKYQMR
ncbi:MAG: hypothetical protein NUV69_02310 [Candidatus Curtissbacteria bacterium]|nr:hypothetical protein [Candidatus Curtissbacteria bacterium]